MHNRTKQKKLLNIELETSEDYDDYNTKYLYAIKNVNDDKCDILSNKNSKLLFHNFDNCLNWIGK